MDKLMSLHLDVIKKKHGPAMVDKILSESIFLFWTNAKRIQHNLEMLVKLNSDTNPTAIIKTRVASSKNIKSVNLHYTRKFPTTTMICSNAKISLQGRNFKPLWGLHNGACGEVIEIVFAPGKSPDKDDLPDYVVCDFPLYCGPAWDKKNPTVCTIDFES